MPRMQNWHKCKQYSLSYGKNVGQFKNTGHLRAQPQAHKPPVAMAAAGLLSLCLVSALAFSSCSLSLASHQRDADRVARLPGQPESSSVSQFAGYVTMNKRHGRALFYWFFEAQTPPEEKPLLLWLNGGPDCSSLGYGAASELGPLRVIREGAALKFNEYAWDKGALHTQANLLFLESPVGAGFSYTNTSSDLDKLNDDFVAEDAYSFLVNWLQRFPEYKDREFYIAGESYAGHYVPQLVALVSERNKEKKGKAYINIKGFIVGNPVTNDYYDSKGLAEYAWSHAVVSDEVYSRINKYCDFKISNWSDDCNAAMNIVYGQYREIDMYNIYAPRCLLNQSSASSANRAFFVNDQFRRRTRMFSGYDPCYSSYAEDYFNKQEVQKAFHANFLLPGKWHACSDLIQNYYNFSVSSVLPIYSKLIKAGLRVWLYSGDADGWVPVIDSRYCVEALGLPIKTQWQPWYPGPGIWGTFFKQGLKK
ncbi:hypothetical protein GQ55_3G120200 [Panicum hallii var. hallii]|uniref:Carboxypeptidase n=1 Tax=Panicum hallii var. hallii TaxID=1504633 RepID=A0A2T7E8J1_9POAL|nr:hypothetical protein GQ55_3G120200 [Panicum hallii var. hallii]